MVGKRSYSRGNVVLAALLLVTAVGFAAVTLDSVRVAQRSKVQLAQAQTATNGGAQNVDGTKCVVGYDFLIKLNADKKAEVYATKGDVKNPIKLPDGNQCANTNSNVSQRGQIPARQCTQAGWRCYVTFCKPKGFTTEALKQEECILINKAIPPGGAVDTQQAAVDSGFSKDVAKAVISGTNEERDGAIGYKVALPDAMRSNLDSAFNDVKAQVEKVDTARANYEEALKNLAQCESLTSTVCLGPKNSVTKADAEYQAELAKLNKLRESAQSLGGSQTTIQPTTPGSVNCPGGPNCQGGEWDATKGQLVGKFDTERCKTNPELCRSAPGGTTFTQSDCARAENQGRTECRSTAQPPPSSARSSGSGGNLLSSLGQFLPMLAGLAGGYLGQNANQPSCTIQASPTSIAKAGQPVTLSWQTQNAQAAYLSNGGQVGPSGSITVYPQQTTTFSLQVVGYPPQQQQQANPYGTTGAQGQYVWNPQLGAYVYVQGQAQQQNPYVQLGQTVGQLVSGSSGGQQTAQCQTQVTVGATSGEGDKPVAQISCQPKIADVGMAVSISYACQNGATASKGEGFSTDNKLSGSASTTVSSPGSGSTTVSYGLTCSKNGVTDSAQCTVNVNKPSIVLVANPKDIERGDSTIVGWVTGAMESCVISSPDDSEFTQEHKNNTSTSGSVRTPRLERDTKFVLTCTTKAGGTKTAETTVNVED